MEGQNVLITGGAGFIGANFVRAFLDMGAHVTVGEREGANLWRLESVKEKVHVIFFDLVNAADVEEKTTAIKPDIVLHFAAYGAYQRFQQDVDATINTNIKGTINLVAACQKIGVKAFINTGTNSEYGIKDTPMKETDVLEPDNLYGITKAAATAYCQIMARKHGFPVVTLRPMAAYGPWEEKGRLMTDVVTACLGNKPLQLSKPDSRRSFLYIDDLIHAYVLAIENIETVKGEIINIGGAQEHAIADVVALVKKNTGSTVEPQYGALPIVQTEAGVWLYDISKAKTLLGWQPKISLEEGLKKDIEWLKDNLQHYA